MLPMIICHMLIMANISSQMIYPIVILFVHLVLVSNYLELTFEDYNPKLYTGATSPQWGLFTSYPSMDDGKISQLFACPSKFLPLLGITALLHSWILGDYWCICYCSIQMIVHCMWHSLLSCVLLCDSDRLINRWLCPIFQGRLEEELFPPEKAAPHNLRNAVSFAPYFISFEGLVV